MNHIRIADILRIVCAYYEIEEAELLAPDQRFAIARKRAVAMYLARIYTGHSYERIGLRFGRCRATVFHGVSRIERRSHSDFLLRIDLAFLRSAIDVFAAGQAA